MLGFNVKMQVLHMSNCNVYFFIAIHNTICWKIWTKRRQSFWQVCQMASVVALIFWWMFHQNFRIYNGMQEYTIPHKMKPRAGEVATVKTFLIKFDIRYIRYAAVLKVSLFVFRNIMACVQETGQHIYSFESHKLNIRSLVRTDIKVFFHENLYSCLKRLC